MTPHLKIDCFDYRYYQVLILTESLVGRSLDRIAQIAIRENIADEVLAKEYPHELHVLYQQMRGLNLDGMKEHYQPYEAKAFLETTYQLGENKNVSEAREANVRAVKKYRFEQKASFYKAKKR